MRTFIIYWLVAAIVWAVPLSINAQPRRHAPDVKEENNADHYRMQINDASSESLITFSLYGSKPK